jgi:predicted PurR-regulated permease PerM
VIVLFLGLYLAIEPRLYLRGMLSLLSPARRDRGREVLGALGHTPQWWLLSKLLAMVVIGTAPLVAVGLVLARMLYVEDVLDHSQADAPTQAG